MSDVAIHVDNLVKVFRARNGTRADVPAVNGLSFDVRRGAIFGLLRQDDDAANPDDAGAADLRPCQRARP
jgi:hypothetical protein